MVKMYVLLLFISLKSEIKEYTYSHPNLKFKETTFKIFCLETGNFKSNLFLKTNNVAGIGYNRSSHVIGRYKGFAKYYTWTNSIEDFLRIQRKVLKIYKPKTSKEYINALRKYGYFKDIHYHKKL